MPWVVGRRPLSDCGAMGRSRSGMFAQLPDGDGDTGARQCRQNREDTDPPRRPMTAVPRRA